MKSLVRSALAMAALLVCAMAAAGTTVENPRQDHDETAYLAANDKLMTTMMDAMMAKPSGDVDHDFVAMMVPHHQGAMDMAQLELLYGHNEQLRRIAQEIIVEQQQEIIAMRVSLGQALPPAMAAPDQVASPPSPPLPLSPATVGTPHFIQDRK